MLSQKSNPEQASQASNINSQSSSRKRTVKQAGLTDFFAKASAPATSLTKRPKLDKSTTLLA